jgi:hypothetical protein
MFVNGFFGATTIAKEADCVSRFEHIDFSSVFPENTYTHLDLKQISWISSFGLIGSLVTMSSFPMIFLKDFLDNQRLTIRLNAQRIR